MAADGAYGEATEHIAEYLLSESRTSLNDAVISQARHRIVDTLVAITAGYQFEEMDVIRNFAQETFDEGPVSLLDGTDNRLNAPGGTLVNSLAANVLDVDDGNRLAQGHPAAVITPAALAAVQSEEGTVGDLIDAFVPAYEIAVRSALAMHSWAGMHIGSGSWGAVGAAAAVSRINDLSLDQTVDALGIAEFNAPITPVMRSVSNPASSMTKDGIGWGGFVGMTGALLAARGLSGSGTVFDEIEYEGLDPELIDSLGDRYHLQESYFKPYPACRWVHSGIDAVRELLSTHDIDPETIEEIHVHTHQKGAELGITRPSTPSEAEYSYPFIIAAALLNGGSLTPETLTRSSRTDGSILALADRVTLHIDEAAQEAYPQESLSRVEIVTSNETMQTGLVNPRGSKERPLSEAELEAKWTMMLDESGGDGTVSALLDDIRTDDLPIHELLAPWINGPQGSD